MKFFTTIFFSFFSLFFLTSNFIGSTFFFFFPWWVCLLFTNLVLGGSICTFTCAFTRAFTLSYPGTYNFTLPNVSLSFLFSFLFSRQICTYFEFSLIHIFFFSLHYLFGVLFLFFSFQGELKHKGFLPNLFFGILDKKLVSGSYRTKAGQLAGKLVTTYSSRTLHELRGLEVVLIGCIY